MSGIGAGRAGEAIVRPPGSINGQQFCIENCADCDIWLLDHSAAVTIDQCERCRVVVGPCESSVFVRDCEDCALAVACRQLRCRDLRRCDALLYSATEPVIESSSRLRVDGRTFVKMAK